MLETARKRLRALVKLIDRQKRKPIYTDFEDRMEAESEIDLPGFDVGDSFDRFRAKARVFLKAHEDHIAIHKLRMNTMLTGSDLDELERMLTASGIGEPGHVRKAKEDNHGLGLFVRSLVGLDRGGEKGVRGIPGRQESEREPDPVREPDRRPSERTRSDGRGAPLRIAVYRRHAARPGRDLHLNTDRRTARRPRSRPDHCLGSLIQRS